MPEDLIYRFAFKLEFGELASKVADTAIKLVRRMDKDWMSVGRRPSGICGACLILAARMFNFRRTVTEVVYIVKVTTATLQKRLDEFKLTATSGLTVDDFLNDVDLESAHDPPAFYEKQEEFIKTKKTRKRKRRGQLPEDDENENQEEADADPNKRHKTTAPNTDDTSPTVELRRDAEGFAIPPQPAQPQSEFDDFADATEEDTVHALETIAKKFSGEEAAIGTSDGEDEDNDDAGSSTTSITTAPKRKGPRPGNRKREIVVPAAWARDEEAIEEDIENQIREITGDPKLAEMVFDPNTTEHVRLFNYAQMKAKKHMADFARENPSKNIRDHEEILEDEFADDPEVQNCLLSEEDIARKEKVWTNENKSWMRIQQIKEYQKRLAANGPPKRTRNRKPKPRMGEGQTSPASTAGEAAVTVMKSRALSKKINYIAVEGLFDEMDVPGGRTLGSAETSRVTSRAGSSVPESPSASDSVMNDGDSEMGDAGDDDESDYIRPAKSSATTPSSTSAPAQSKNLPPPATEESEDEDEDEDDEDLEDYEEYEEPADSTWKKLSNRDRGVEDAPDEDAQSGGEEDYDEGNDMGEIDVFGDD